MKYPAHVYVLLVGQTGKVYVGLSHDPKARFARHKSLLLAGKHPVEDMQADFDASDKYLRYAVVDEVRNANERYKEHKWQVLLHSYERDRGYNYKDPTASGELEKHEQKKRCKAFLKAGITKGRRQPWKNGSTPGMATGRKPSREATAP